MVGRSDKVINFPSFVFAQFGSGERSDILQRNTQLSPTVG